MPLNNPSTEIARYNGVSWLGLYKSRLSARPVPDEARRATKYIEYGLEIDGYVTAPLGSTSTDAQLAALRRCLTQPGGPLVYKGKGYGTLAVNSPADGPARDVAYGPWPELLDAFPVGDSRANGLTVDLSATGTLSATFDGPPAGHSTHLIFDVTGYFR